MEASLFTLIGSLVESGTIADTTLLLIIIALIGLAYINVVKPMFDRIKTVPTSEEVKAIVETAEASEGIDIEELSKKLDKITEVLDEVEDLNRGNYREVKELKRDIEQIKQILNQFQGHLMYGSRSSSFGNRELK